MILLLLLLGNLAEIHTYISLYIICIPIKQAHQFDVDQAAKEAKVAAAAALVNAADQVVPSKDKVRLSYFIKENVNKK